ncbi:hypothetical protein ACFLXI_08490, partial [Chloroflexota bacterium]
RAFEAESSGDYETAIIYYDSIANKSHVREVVFTSKQKIVDNLFLSGDIESVINNSAQLFHEYPDEITNHEIESLWTAIYKLGKEKPLDEAIEYVKTVEEKYPSKWLTVYSLGMSGYDYSLFIGDKIRHFSALPEEEVVIRILLEKFPEDEYASLAQIIVGDFKLISDNSPEHKYYDWALYKTAQNAYDNMLFSDALEYYWKFLENYPTHRWADDALYRMVKSYELSGNHFDSLDTIIKGASSYTGDGDMIEVLMGFRIALIDTYFDSDDIIEYLILEKDNLPRNDALFLEICLAEQYFKENKFIESLEIFTRIDETYPESSETEDYSATVNLLNEIIPIIRQNNPDKAIELAKNILAPERNWGYSGPIFYNDLYKGKRIINLKNIGLNGPTWGYMGQANDNLQAATILENFIKENPDHPKVPEALYLLDIAYYNLTYEYSFTPAYVGSNQRIWKRANMLDAGLIAEEDISKYPAFILEKLTEIGNKLLLDYPKSSYTPEALTLSGIGFCKFQEFEICIEFMRRVVDIYPNDNLANNALIFIARTNRDLGDHASDTTTKELYYRKALAVYNEVIEKYPSGHVGEEAKEEYILVLAK